MNLHKLGRKPRAHNPLPLFTAFKRRQQAQLTPPPITLDNTAGMNPDFGVMLNDQLGDCTCAAYGHAMQVWSFTAGGSEVTDPDADVLDLYEQACGYNAADPNTDQGGVEQDVLAYLLNTGMPTGADGSIRHKIAAYLEVNFKSLDDLKRTIADCGVAYIGIDVPQSVMDNAGDPTIPWDTTGDQTIVGGHAVVLVGYDLDFFYCISWGKKYKITHNFLGAHLDEAYAIADPLWIKATGKTPLGMTLTDLEAMMKNLRQVAA